MDGIKFYRESLPLEAFLWLIALMVFMLIDPGVLNHISLCPFKNMGFYYCPGCGLGRSVSLALHRSFKASFQTHPLGIFAIIVLSFRVINLIGKWVKKSLGY